MRRKRHKRNAVMTQSITKYFTGGIVFLREHPQLWSTALVACIICGSFVFMSLRFAGIAEDAQKQLFNDRAGWLLDGVALFAPDLLTDTQTLRARLQALKVQNEIIDSLSIIVPNSNGGWRLYVSDTGVREGLVIEYDPLLATLAQNALGNPNDAYTAVIGEGNERIFVTMRAMQNVMGETVAIVMSRLRLSEADRLIERDVTMSMVLLVVVLVVIATLFFRHARIVDFATLYKKQLEIDELKDSFLGMASHELKSPLTVIRGYIEFLREGMIDEDTKKEYLRRIDVSANELRQLVDDILDVSRIEMGRLRFSPDYVTPAVMLEEVVDMFKVTAEGKGLTLSSVVAEGTRDMQVRVDSGRLKQIVVNLVSNAVKYTLAGGVTVEQHVIGTDVELSVRDTGVGMTADEQKKLFAKFYRVEATETKGVSGTGLGLWITKYMIENMGGSISVESIKGKGSRFVVRFPLYKQSELTV